MGEIFKAQKAGSPLRAAGERVTSEVEGQSVYEHLHRYFFAREHCRGRDVLDVASGEGYGSAYLAQCARSVVGVDLAEEAVAHASSDYSMPNLRYLVGNACKLTFPDASFDVVVSFETIEHLDNQQAFLKEIRRVLRPDGILIISWPNSDVYSPVAGPVNPFHVRELTRDELLSALGAEFRSCVIYGQRPLTGGLLVAERDGRNDVEARFETFEKRDDNHFEASDGLARPLYFVVVASNGETPPVFSSAYIETVDVDASIRCRKLADKAGHAAEETGHAVEKLRSELVRLQTALATAQARAAERVLEQRAELSARERLQSQVSRLREERDLLARELTRAYHRPLKTIRHFGTYHLLKTLGALEASFSERAAARFRRSAQKRNPRRFDKFLAPPIEPAPGLPSPLTNAIVLPDDERQLGIADVTAVHLPTSQNPRVSVIIPCYGKPWLTLQCLKSIASHPPATPFEVIVADNASGDPGVELLRNISGLRLEINPTNLGFLRSCNRSAKFAKGDYLFFLNNDTLVREHWLDPLLAVFGKFADAGLVGSKLLFADGTLQEAGGIIWRDGSASNYGRSDDPNKPVYNYIREADYISGCAILVPRMLWEQLGGFDEHFAPGYCEDSDLSFRVRAAGRKVYYCPFSVIVHLEGVTHGTNVKSGVKSYQIANTKKLYQRWRDVLEREHFPAGAEIMRARDRSRDRKTALVVDHYVPQPDQDAGSRTMIAMIECLKTAGYIVKFWPDNLIYDPIYTGALQSSGIEVLFGISLSFDDWIKDNGSAISLALLSRPTFAPRYIPALRQHSEATIVFYGHDLHFERMSMEAGRTGDAQLAAEAAAMERVERSVWKQVDVVLYPSLEEAAVAGSVSPRAASVVPYAYHDFGAERQPPDNRNILFVAGFGHPPNANAAEWLVRDILKRIWEQVPDATLSIVGSNPTDAVRALAEERVEVTGRVTEAELRARYARARVAIVPLQVGAGVKSKVVEALREGLPIVTTSVGAQGLAGIEDTIRIADDAPGIAEAAVQLLLDDARWSEASIRQVDYARTHFSRAAFGRSFLGAIGERG